MPSSKRFRFPNCSRAGEQTPNLFLFPAQGRGSENPNTGPIRDHSSFASNSVTGAFAYINAMAPRRPQDKAQMVSKPFPATEKNSPLCLR